MKYLFRLVGAIIFSIIVLIIAWKFIDTVLGGVPGAIVKGAWKGIKKGSAALGINPVWSVILLLIILAALGSKKKN